MLAGVIEKTVQQTETKSVRIGHLEMVLRENLQAYGRNALKQFLENADLELEVKIEYTYGGH